tara:strand:+ start:57 stop:1016 length:960 start_codon:yes stop_codon:yes gene_type:complete
MEEEWKDITKPYPIEGYKISSYGRIKSYKAKEPYIMNASKDSNGYPKCSLSTPKKGPKYSGAIHRLVALNFIPFTRFDNEEWWNNMPKEIQELFFYSAFQVNHIDGNKTNNCVDNLEWATPQENSKHYRDNNYDSKKHKKKMKEVGKKLAESGSLKGANNPRFGKKFSDEMRENQRQNTLGEKNPMHGKERTEKDKESIGNSLKKYYKNNPPKKGKDSPAYGTKHSDETKQKIGKGVKKFIKDNPDRVHPQQGKPLSEERKKKQSKAMSGVLKTEEHKKKITEGLLKFYKTEKGLEKIKKHTEYWKQKGGNNVTKESNV